MAKKKRACLGCLLRRSSRNVRTGATRGERRGGDDPSIGRDEAGVKAYGTCALGGW